MLRCEMNGDTLHVIEEILGWKKAARYHWYYDTTRWLKSVNGREGDAITCPMTQSQIDWVKANYLPKAHTGV